MNNYDKYINDDLLTRIFKSRLEDKDKDALFDNVFCNEFDSKTVYATCAVNEAKFYKKDFEEALKLLNKEIKERRRLILEFLLKYNDSIIDEIKNECVGKTEQPFEPVFKLYPPYFSI